jgi:hypothetical protein
MRGNEWTEVAVASSGDFRLEIHVDADGDHANPRQWDNLGTMLTWTRNYHSPDTNRFDTPDDFTAWWVEEGHAADESAVLLPVYMLDHGSVSFSTSDYNDRWDSGQVGWIYATAADAEMSMVPDVTEALRREVETFSQWASGSVYLWALIQLVRCDHCQHVEENVVDAIGAYIGEIDASDIFFPTDI